MRKGSKTGFGFKRKLKISVGHKFDLPVNCRFGLGRLVTKRASRAEHASLTRLFSSAMWPSKKTRWDIDSITKIVPVQLPAANYIGQFFSTKLGRVVRYECEEQRNFFRRLERAHSVLWYVERPLTIPFFHEGRALLHVPTVMVWLRNERVILCEISAVNKVANALHSSVRDALLQYCVQAGWGALITDGTRLLIEECQG